MRFSLKDLMWSVSFASVGIAALTMAIRNDGDLGFSQHINDLLGVVAILSFGPLLGAAIGKLFRKSMQGAAWGILIWIIFWFVSFAVLASLE